MSVCEVIEIRNSADAVGYSCSGMASKECSDCGIQLCEDHAEPCGTCFSIFCRPAVSYIERNTQSLHMGNVENEKGPKLRTLANYAEWPSGQAAFSISFPSFVHLSSALCPATATIRPYRSCLPHG